MEAFAFALTYQDTYMHLIDTEGCNTTSIFKSCTNGLNSVFFFS